MLIIYYIIQNEIRHFKIEYSYDNEEEMSVHYFKRVHKFDKRIDLTCQF